jgi:hypothetical protein
MNGEKRNAYRILVGKSEGKITLERPRCRQVDNSKMNLRRIGLGGKDWIGLVQDSVLVNTVMNLWGPSNAGQFLSGCSSDGPLRRAQLHGDP